MFAADVNDLSVGFASKLKTVLEQHIGLRVFYREIEYTGRSSISIAKPYNRTRRRSSSGCAISRDRAMALPRCRREYPSRAAATRASGPLNVGSFVSAF